MKNVRVGITVPGSIGLERDAVVIYAAEPAAVTAFGGEKCPQLESITDWKSIPVSADRQIVVSARDGNICVEGLSGSPSMFDRWLVFYKVGPSHKLFLKEHNKMSQVNVGVGHAFRGKFIVGADHNKIRVILECDLEDYIKGVLGGEMPASYALEALKAQAVAARTYALKPRVDHTKDFCNVCDSFLCCQCFVGLVKIQNERHREAIEATSGQVLTYNDTPILALFSACAGGHTESYEFCFSNPETNAFPDAPLPYLVGVPECKASEKIFDQDPESAIKYLWHAANPQTYDAWSKHFRWQVSLTAQSLESHMHYIVQEMLNDPKQAPFVLPPQSSIFGHIESFEIEKRGKAGTAMVLSVKTSKGIWRFKKELIIRSLFKNPDLGLKRLASARMFLDHHYDSNSLLSTLKIFGLGSGHGVGMQQDGAEGMARGKATYREILGHYYSHARIDKV